MCIDTVTRRGKEHLRSLVARPGGFSSSNDAYNASNLQCGYANDLVSQVQWADICKYIELCRHTNAVNQIPGASIDRICERRIRYVSVAITRILALTDGCIRSCMTSSGSVINDSWQETSTVILRHHLSSEYVSQSNRSRSRIRGLRALRYLF